MDKIICIGKNYLEHAKELGDAVPEKPVLFLKPPSALVDCSGPLTSVRLPSGKGQIHPECELVVRLGSDAKSIEAVTLGLDMTLRDLQAVLKKNGHPWEIAKAFPSSAPVGKWIKIADAKDWLTRKFTFTVNGTLRQSSTGDQMRLNPDDCIRHAADHFKLLPGDLIFTGTPAGVGPVKPGDKCTLEFDGLLKFEIHFE